MSDNITGFGGGSDEINLGLNINSNVGGSINDFNTLDQVLQQIIKDEEAFNGIQNDSFEKAKALTQEIKGSAEQAQQLISIFKTLRGEQQGTLQDAKQLASVYQQLNNELQKTVQNKTRLNITSLGTPSGAPGSIPSNGGTGPIPGVPSTQTSGAGGGGIRPPNTSPIAGFPQEPDDFFGTGGRPNKSLDVDTGAPDIFDVENAAAGENPFDIPTGGPSSTRRVPGRAQPSSYNNEKYRQLSDLAWTIFPNRGYYRNMRRVRWLTRNEGSSINKFVNSTVGKRVGTALNRLGGGQHLRTSENYQLFPFIQDAHGDYIDKDGNVISGLDNLDKTRTQYGLQDANGNWISSAGSGLEGAPWAWNGEGAQPPIDLPPGTVPLPFNPWNRPNLTATGEGAAKVAGATFALNAIRAKGSGLFREGQLFTGITGGTGIAGALKYDLGSQLTSWFGLNPLESYGQAKQINMQNLSLGYRGNLLNQANSFGNTALQHYGVDPQTSMQMFGQMVMQAGASLSDLNTSLGTLAHTASTTNTSFSMLQQSAIQYSQLGASIGLTGSQNTLFATSAAQYAAGQPGLQATGANPANIMDSMVGQALVAQQMGTSYLGLPGAAQQQGAMGVVKGEVKANEQLFNNMGISRSNYGQSANYQRFKLVEAALGNTKEANLSYAQYLNYMRDMYSGKAQKELQTSINSKFAIGIGGTAGENAGSAIAGAIQPINALAHGWRTGREGQPTSQSAITEEMQATENNKKWKNIGVSLNGKFMSLSNIEQLPFDQRQALEAKIATGDVTISHKNQHGKLIKGNYTSGTLMDLRGQSKAQFDEFGNNPNRVAMHKAELRALSIELGPDAKKYLTLLENGNGLNRYLNKNWSAQGVPTSRQGSLRTSNNK
jgi:hypothetical protein